MGRLTEKTIVSGTRSWKILRYVSHNFSNLTPLLEEIQKNSYHIEDLYKAWKMCEEVHGSYEKAQDKWWDALYTKIQDKHGYFKESSLKLRFLLREPPIWMVKQWGTVGTRSPSGEILRNMILCYHTTSRLMIFRISFRVLAISKGTSWPSGRREANRKHFRRLRSLSAR